MQNAGLLPSSVVAGETIWISSDNTTQNESDIVLSDYSPSDGYTLAYQFTGVTPATVAAEANGTDTGWTLTIPAATTLTWKAGEIHFAGLVTHTATARVFAVDSGSIKVIASPLATSAWTDVIEKCDAAIADYAANPHGSFSVDGMQITYRSMDSLIKLRNFAVSKRDEETGNRPRRIIRTRFT
jgi:hypothetical protein